MSFPLIALRPEPGLSSTLNHAKEMGLEVRGFALSRVEAVEWMPPSRAEFDGLLIGSASAFHHGGNALENFTHLPVYAVGKSTAKAAKDIGFKVETVGTGGLQGVLDGLTAPLRLLRLAGEERIDLAAPHGISITERVVYRVVTQPLPDDAAELLRSGATALLYSAASAAHFAQECERHSLDKSRISLAALGPRIADAAGRGWRAIHVPDRPNEGELLEMLHAL